MRSNKKHTASGGQGSQAPNGVQIKLAFSFRKGAGCALENECTSPSQRTIILVVQ